MELQQERLVRERWLQHDQFTALQQLIIDEFNQILDLALLDPGDRTFVRHSIAYLRGRGVFTDFHHGLTAGYDWRDNARLYFVTAMVYTLAPEGAINGERLARMVAYLKDNRYLADELDDRLERLTGMRSSDVLALAA